jgi:hypothetical protein
VYNQQFESQRLWELAGWLPEYTERIRGIQRWLWDLLLVVCNRVYHPAFGGSFSLKAVLPALVPEMTYEGMEVPNGQAAGVIWGGDHWWPLQRSCAPIETTGAAGLLRAGHYNIVQAT